MFEISKVLECNWGQLSNTTRKKVEEYWSYHSCSSVAFKEAFENIDKSFIKHLTTERASWMFLPDPITINGYISLLKDRKEDVVSL